jgi:hypothetical protein
MPILSEAQIAEIIHQLTEDRGFIINSFAQLECLLADLIDQCREIAAYKELSGKPFPFGVKNRVDRVRELARSGPLGAHADTIDRVLSRFMEFEDLRHLFVHGFATFAHTADGDAGMSFVRFVPPPKGGEVTMVREFYRSETMKAQLKSSLEFIGAAMATFREIYTEIGLDPDRLSTFGIT